MKAGDLRHRITIQAKSVVADGLLGQTESWTDTATVWAAIWPKKGAEAVSNGRIQGTVTHQIRIRYRSGVDIGDRIKYDSRYFNILSAVNWEERNIHLDLMCEEVV